MKVSCLQENLSKGLSLVGRAVTTRSTLPVLANIMTATDNSRLRLSATNLELGITCWIGAKVEDEGSTTIPANTLVDLVNALPKERVDMSLTLRTHTMNVRCGSYNNDIKCIDAQEFPLLPSAETEDAIELNVQDLREMIEHVVFASATDDSRPVLTGVEVKIDGDNLSFAAADGFRLAVRNGTLSSPATEPMTAIIPARALIELGRIAGDPDDPVAMTLLAGRNQVIFQLKDVELVSQLIEGEYPDYKQLIPSAHTTRSVVSTDEFRNACRAASIFARESAYTVRLKIVPGGELEPGTIEVTANSPETGSNETMVEATIEGDPVEIAFNVKYLMDVLSVIDTPHVALETSTPSSPGVIRPVGREDFLSVIMPMHIGA